ncbi:MAG: hypothetical protein N4A43_04870 [Alphaproteobacteria bacterium]|jgi:GH24 family phage-related lysozyme (muramidase)|nr:hypothetical protein [Alphaproteobacteria bacterium]
MSINKINFPVDATGRMIRDAENEAISLPNRNNEKPISFEDVKSFLEKLALVSQKNKPVQKSVPTAKKVAPKKEPVQKEKEVVSNKKAIIPADIDKFIKSHQKNVGKEQATRDLQKGINIFRFKEDISFDEKVKVDGDYGPKTKEAFEMTTREMNGEDKNKFNEAIKLGAIDNLIAQSNVDHIQNLTAQVEEMVNALSEEGSGKRKIKGWVYRTKGEETCEVCQSKEGKEYKSLYDTVDYPSHPNCDCILEPIYEDEKSEDNQEEQEKEENNDEKENKKEDQKLINNIYDKIYDFEKPINHPYLDINGDITTGIGDNIDGTSNPEKTFIGKPWQKEGRPATQSEKQAEWNNLQDIKDKKDYNYLAEDYEDKTSLRLPEGEAERQAREHIKQNIDNLRDKYPTYDKAPEEIQRVLADLEYNIGEGNFSRKKWPELSKGMDNKDWSKVADNVSRKTKHKERNDWAIKTAKEGVNRLK